MERKNCITKEKGKLETLSNQNKQQHLVNKPNTGERSSIQLFFFFQFPISNFHFPQLQNGKATRIQSTKNEKILVQM